MEKIVYLCEVPMTWRDFRRFGIGHFLDREVAVTLIEVTAITNPTLKPRPGDSELAGRVDIRRPASLVEMMELEGNLSDADLIVCLMGFTGDLNRLRVFRMISRSDTPYLAFSANAYPGHDRFIGEPGHLMDRLSDIARRLVQGEINPLDSFIARLPWKTLGMPPASYTVYGGRSSRRNRNIYTTAATHAIDAHSLDYDLFLEASKEPVETTNTAVFLDEFVGSDWDFIARNAAQTENPDTYYPLLRKLFDRIEAELDLRVVIAANPRADYSDAPDPFGGRRIEYQRTAGLISRCRLVIAHRSTALGFAVMFRKPVMLVATRRMHGHWASRPLFDSFSEALGKPVQFIDRVEDIDMGGVFDFDAARYESYMRDYIKLPGTPDRPFWDIVGSEIEHFPSEKTSPGAIAYGFSP